LKGNLEAPLDIPGTLLPSKPSFLARTSVFAEDAVDILSRAVATEGFALVDVWDLCVAYYAGQNTFSRDTVEGMMADLGMPPGVLYEGGRPEYARAWRELYHEEVADEEGMCFLPPEHGLEKMADSRLGQRTSILIAGAAGQKIRSAATLLGAGALMSGLQATQKDDYPITVRTGHSAAEVILAPESVLYTGVGTPDIVLVLSVEGLGHILKKLPGYPATTRIYLEQGLLGPDAQLDTRAQVIPLALVETAKSVHKLAIGAVGLGAVLAREGLYPAEAFVAAARKLQKAKVADTNIAGLEAGIRLVAGI
jgi:Pyruvate/2-oxoacid:ferredoxin oxidoreductase gamma subunit